MTREDGRFELGIFTFGHIRRDPVTGEHPSFERKLRQTVELAALADEVGLDVFAVGEHHRLDMAVSAPPVVLAACAEATEHIHLSPATTLLNTLDPVRVFEDFATLDLLSGGRVELLVGRGSFTESWHLFGKDQEKYDELFAENLDLLMQLNKHERVTWEGQHRSPLEDAEISPRPEAPLPIWIGMGGSPGSARRAGRLGLPLNIAILSQPERFAPVTRLYREAAAEAGHDAQALPVAVASHGLVLDDATQARDAYWERYSDLTREGLYNRFPPREVTRAQFDQEVGQQGAILAGDPEEIVDRIRWQRDVLGIDRMLLQLDWGGMPHEMVRRSVELLGTEVAPALREDAR